MCTNAIQISVKYRKSLTGVVLRSRVFFDNTPSLNDYEIQPNIISIFGYGGKTLAITKKRNNISSIKSDAINKYRKQLKYNLFN